MHLPLLKPWFCCGAGRLQHQDKKKPPPSPPPPPSSPPSPLSPILIQLKEAQEEASEAGSLVKSQELVLNQPNNNAQIEFLKATASLTADQIFESRDSIPGLQDAFSKFLTTYPKYKSSQQIDQLRSDQYSFSNNVCLDYTGFGLFSYLQTVASSNTSTFSLSGFPPNHGHGIKAQIEDYLNTPCDVKAQIMDFLNIPKNEYGLVFTANRGSAFALLAESYPFHTNTRLLTMFDHESESVNRMARIARDKGATVESDWFDWPTFNPCSTRLRDHISRSTTTDVDRARGLFVFPVQSRVTGAKYSYQWLAMARRNNWHVLLDAGAIGPKEMDSLALSFFQPDFIITSFHRVFGHDPSGFGCLLVKKSALASLQGVARHDATGIVTINPVDVETDDENGNIRSPCGIIRCGHLEQINMLSLDKTVSRQRFLINWLVASMLQLRLAGTNGALRLVDIYGPKISYERGGAVAFNVRDRNRGLISPEVVQKSAELEGISLGVGKLIHMRIDDEDDGTTRPVENGEGGFVRVVTASLGFLSDFEDVYRLWAFVAKFLDPGFPQEGGVVEEVER